MALATKEDFRRLMEHAYHTAYSTGDVSVLEPYYHPHHKVHTDFHNTDKKDHDGSNADAESWAKTISGMTTKLKHVLLDGDFAVVHWSVGGKHTGSHKLTVAGNVEATQKDVQASGVILFKLRDGRIEEEWRYDDILQSLAAAGAVKISAGTRN